MTERVEKILPKRIGTLVFRKGEKKRREEVL
jgi:hypothetical protein